MTALIEAHGVSRSFVVGRGLLARRQAVRAVVDVDIAIARGEVLGLVGESGCGKSTLAKMLLGLIPSDSGTIRIAGADIATLPRRVLARHIQPVFQDPYSSLNPRKSVASIVALPLAVLGVFLREALDPGRQVRVGAGDLLQVFGHQGEKRLDLDRIEALPLPGELVFLDLEGRDTRHGTS